MAKKASFLGVPPKGPFGIILALFWYLVLFWYHFGIHFGSLCYVLGVHLGSFWCHFGSLWGPLGHFGPPGRRDMIWDPLLEHFGVTFGTPWGPLGRPLGTPRGQKGSQRLSEEGSGEGPREGPQNDAFSDPPWRVKTVLSLRRELDFWCFFFKARTTTEEK